MAGLDDAFRIYSKRSADLEVEDLKSYAFEMIENIKTLKPEDGFDVLDLLDKKKFSPRDSQFVLETLPELSNNEISKDLVTETQKILGIQSAANSTSHFKNVIEFVAKQDTAFRIKLIDKADFANDTVKDEFVSALEIAYHQNKTKSEPEELYHELKTGGLSHAFNIKSVSSLPDADRIGVVKMMTSNSILDAAIKKNDLGTFVGHMDSLTESAQDVLTSIYLESNDKGSIEFAEKSIDYQIVKEGVKNGLKPADIARDNDIPMNNIVELEEIAPEIKPASPSYSLSSLMSEPGLG